MRQMVIAAAFLGLLVSWTADSLAQSGRNRNSQVSTVNPSETVKPGASTPSNVEKQPDDVVSNSTLPPGGETVEGDVVKVETNLVTVPVRVMDRDGKYVPDLDRGSFRLYDEGVEQRIAYFATVDKPFTVALVIDTSASTDIKLEDIQNAAIAFVGQLREDDRVMVVSFDDQIKVLCEPTSDRDQMVRAIRRTHTGGGTRLYDAVDFIIMKRLQGIQGRKAVVLFTDGVDTTSRHATYNSTVREAEEQDALIYTVDYDTFGDSGYGGWGRQTPFPRRRGGIIFGSPFPGGSMPGSGGGAGSTREEYARGAAYLHDLSEKTGARFYNGNSLQNASDAFEQVAEELRRQYSLGYYPSATAKSGQRRQIKVRVNQPNLVVVARDSYIYTGKSDTSGQGNAQEQQPAQSNRKPNQLSQIL
jgi:Ca-activated chloride channel family protein